MFLQYLLLLIAASLPAPLAGGLNYSVIEATGKTCPGLDRCQLPLEQTAEGPEVSKKGLNCYCDDQVCTCYDAFN